MGLKIEWVLSIAIVIIVVASLTLKLNDAASKVKPITKELEFTYTTFTEVDTKKLQGRAYGTYGVRDNDVLTINDLVYQTETIESLVADKATYMGENIYLEGDVVLDQTDGYTYETEQAEYNQKSEILNITAPFVATRDENIIRGDTLRYDTRKEEVYGTMIDAIVYTIEK